MPNIVAESVVANILLQVNNLAASRKKKAKSLAETSHTIILEHYHYFNQGVEPNLNPNRKPE